MEAALTERRTAVDFAPSDALAAGRGPPTAKVIRVVLDNLNTHSLASLDTAFAPLPPYSTYHVQQRARSG
jgi:hypothetical protein